MQTSGAFFLASIRKQNEQRMINAASPIKEYALPITRKRKLGIAEFGVQDGFPVFWFPGTPGGRRQVPYEARQFANNNKLRIICVERPGIGLSTRYLYEDIHAFSDDIAFVIEQLSIEKCGVVALSGGGPYALACANALSEQVVAAAVFGGVAPTIGEEAAEGGPTAKAVPVEKLLTWMKRPLGSSLTWGVRMLHPVANPVVDAIVKYIPGHETAMIARPEIRDMFLDDILDSSKGGLHSIVHDIILFARPWGFSLSGIAVPVHFWQSDEDPLVPVEHARAMSALIPNSALTVCENAGHLEGLNKTAEALGFILDN
ncbi:MAG: alpha/beta hydrolase, partial [Pseudomonadales bacterium]|nr:alpha/beta hydrolase [Pseudomonadales bacterium]